MMFDKNCGNCKHAMKKYSEDPCKTCRDDYGNWVPQTQYEKFMSEMTVEKLVTFIANGTCETYCAYDSREECHEYNCARGIAEFMNSEVEK